MIKDNEENVIEDKIENWESGELGTSPEFAKKSNTLTDAIIEDACDLKAISIRLEKSLIEDFKAFSRIYDVGYQPLIRQVLTRFAEGEKRMLLKQMKAREAAESAEAEEDTVALQKKEVTAHNVA